MNYKMIRVAFLVIITSLVALLVVGTEGSVHTVFANRDSSGHVTNRGINVQTETNQDQGCEGAGGTSGITNACTATSGRGSTQTSTETQISINFGVCSVGQPFTCQRPMSPPPDGCSGLGCTSISCTGSNPFSPTSPAGTCTTDNGVQLTSCILSSFNTLTCTSGTETHTVPGTGITQSGGVSG